jgi:ATP-dependent RNA helicase RhlE
MTFANLGLSKPLLDALAAKNYTTPTPIQRDAIPLVRSGRDLLGIAQTGTGKTAAFILPALDRLVEARRAPVPGRVRMLVLAPTRELASQIAASARTYGANLRMTIGTVFGGVSNHKSVREVARGLDILVATPGRLLDLVDQRALDLSQLEILVLDEADQMLDLGFIHALKRIVALVPKKRQTLFFSATMPKAIRTLADAYLTNPAEVAVKPAATTAERIAQTVTYVNQGEKAALLTLLLKDIGVERALVFSRTKHGADKIVRQLAAAGVTSAAIHGNKSQPQRERAIAAFKTGHTRILVATDIAARGIDIPGVSHVFNFDLPDVPEQYVHRIGRTARAGAAGIAVAFCAPDERGNLRDIERLTRITLDQRALPEGFLAAASALKALKLPAPERDERPFARGRGGQRNDRNERGGGERRFQRSSGPRPAHAGERKPDGQRHPVHAGERKPDGQRHPVRTGERKPDGQRHPQRAEGHPGHRPSGGQGKRPFRGRGRPGGGQRASG